MAGITQNKKVYFLCSPLENVKKVRKAKEISKTFKDNRYMVDR